MSEKLTDSQNEEYKELKDKLAKQCSSCLTSRSSSFDPYNCDYVCGPAKKLRRFECMNGLGTKAYDEEAEKGKNN